MSKMFKFTILIVLFYTILLHDAESRMVNLQTDFNQHMINGLDPRFTFIDSYFNNCLSKIDYCFNGMAGSFNLTVLYSQMNEKYDASYNYGRLVLFSSGAESPYSRGGIYLHQINVRGEEYLQLGITHHGDLFTSDIYLKNKSTTRIGYIWNRNSLEIYVDGSEHENIVTPSKRAYLDLNFNPIKTYHFFSNNGKQTILNQIWFADNLVDSSKKYILGEESDYLIGCYVFIREPDNSKSLLYDPNMAYFLQCKELCKISKSKYSVLNGDQCTCFENDQILEQSVQKSDCLGENSWKIYTTTNIRYDMPIKKLDLKVDTIIIQNPIEIGDPVGLQIKSLSDQNYILSVNFGESQVKSVIGDSFLFYEYENIGQKKIIISAFSIMNRQRSFNHLIEFNINSASDREPMHSVNLKVDPKSERDVEVTVVSAGGLPYTCQLNMGDSSPTISLKPVNRVHKFINKYSYTLTGLYNISVLCVNQNGIGNQMTSSMIMYLPDLSKASVYNVFDNTYVAKTYSQIIIPRPKDSKFEIDLALPFATLSSGLELKVLDPFNKNIEINFSKNFSSKENQLKIKLNAENLKNYNENYFQVVFKHLILASYLIVLEDSKDLSLSVNIATKILVENKPIVFEITLSRTSNCLLRVDFGDGKVKFFTMHSFEKPDKENYILKLDHIYTLGMNFYQFKVSLANHLQRIEKSKDLHFETSLPRFVLQGRVVHVPDVNMSIDFRLFTDAQIEPVKVDMINITFDSNNFLIFKDYNFSKLNSFSLNFRHAFDKHGYFDVTANCSNQISFQISVFKVKVGLDLNSATGVILKNFANVYELIIIKLNINGGNGYKIIVDFDDGKKMLLPWRYVSSLGRESQSIPGYIKANAVFNQSGIYVPHQYSLPGLYEPKVNIINPFGQIDLKFCAKIEIVPEPVIQTNETMDPSCFTTQENINLFLNNVSVGNEKNLKIARGMPNIFHTGFVSCAEAELNNLAARWVLMRIPVGRSIDYEMEHLKYCSKINSDNYLSFEASELEFGNYTLRVYTYRISEPENYVFLGIFLVKVETSPLKVSLNNGIRSVELNFEEPYLLRYYERTYDPDSKILSDKTDFEFYFVCVQDFYSRRELVKNIQASISSLEFDMARHDLNLAFYSDHLKTWFYEKECFKVKPQVTMAQNPISVKDKDLLISGDTLYLNQSLAMSLQLYAIKKGRVSASQQIIITMNMSRLFSISLDSDFDQINQQLSKLDDLAKQNPQKALNILTNFASVVNNKAADPVQNQTRKTNNSNSDAGREFSNIRNRMLGTVGNIVDRVDDGDSILTAAQTVGSVSSNSDQMPIENQDTGSLAIEKMGEKAKNLGDQGPEMANEIASSILGATGNTFDAAIKTVPVAQNNVTDPALLEPEIEIPPVILPAKITAPLEFYECDDCDDFPDEVYEEILIQEEKQFQQDEETRKHTAEIAKRTFNGVSGAGLALASSSCNGSNLTRIQQKNMALIVGKKSLNDTDESETEFSTDGGLSIVMPVLSSVVNKSNSSIPPSIVTSMIASNENPLQSSRSKATGMIVSLKLTDDFGNPIVINNTAEPFNIKVPASFPVPLFRAYVNQTGIIYHKLFLATNSSSLHVVVKPEIPGDMYHLFIKYSNTRVTDVYPDEKHHDYSFTLPNMFYSDPSNELMYTAFISNNETKGNGTYYIGIKLAVVSNQSRIWLNETNSTNYLSYYNIKIFSTSCKYWKEEAKEWGTDGCYVGPNTNSNITECLCYHLTTFGTDFYVPPNTIDFSTVFGKFKNLHENAAVFATVVSVLGLYVLSAIYFRYKDKKDLIKWGATPLADNLPTDRHFYLISVQTGVGKTTGTTSKIGFVLSGDQADSGVRKLTDDKRKAFKSGSICNFIMGVEEPLGSLQYLRIWHDNSGKGDSKSWYLNMVTVIDLKTNEKSNFVCNQWFAVEKDDGQIDRVIPEACQNDLVSFKHLFTQSVKKKFTDSHLWFSVFARPSKSSFTRIQRLSCCMSLLFTTMIANAMFYQSEENTQAKSGVLEIGPIKFTMTQLYTSVISTMIVVPVNLIIVTLFRKAKLKRTSLLKSRKTGHIARQQYWRKVKQIENIELPDNEDMDRSSYINADFEQNTKSDFEIKNKKKQNLFNRLFSRNRNLEYKRESTEDARNKKLGRNFPHWVIYISWFLVFVSILVPAFFVILYSLEWGKERSEAWLVSLFLSFFQSLLVVDPLKVFIITAVITWILKKPDEEDDSLIDSGDPLYNAIVNHDEEYLHTTMSSLSQIDIREIAQSRRSKLATLKPIDPVDLERQRIERKNAVKLREIIREAASYLSFFLVVLFLSYQARSKNTFYVHKDLSNALLNNKEIAFRDIQSRDDIWNYIEKVFVPSMYAPMWYNGRRLNWREKLTTSNRYFLRVGASRIRQLRIKENSCIVNSKMAKLFDHCRNNYNWIDDDNKDYDVRWKPIINGTLTNSSSTRAEAGIKRRKTKWKCQNAWCYQNSLQTKSAPILGSFTTYKGGGYAMSLGRTIERTQNLLTALKSEKWIDELTRAVFMEFSLYNPNVNLFSSGTLIVEYLSTGAAITYQTISVFTLYTYLGSFGIVVLIFEIIYIIYIIYFLIIELLKMKKEKFKYFKQFWNLNELVIISFSIISMVMYVMRALFARVAIKTVFESELGEFVNFNTIGLWDEIFNGVSAIIVFCATLKFMKLLRFNKHIGILAATLKHASKDLFSFSVTFGIIFMAFTQFGNLIFGSINQYYKDFISSLSSSFRFALGQFNLKDLQSSNYVLGSIYFIIFILTVIMGLMSMFITILDQAYHEVKEKILAQKKDNEIVDYFISKIKKLKPKKKKTERRHSSELNASTTSLRVNVKQNDKIDSLYSTSFKSLNITSASQYESHESMSLY